MNIFLEAAHLSPITVLCVEFRIPGKQEAAARSLHHSKCVKKQESWLAQSQAPRQVREKLRVHIGKKEIHQQWYNVCGKCHKTKGKSSNKLLGRGFARFAIYNRLTQGDCNPTTKPQLAMKPCTSESQGKTPGFPAHPGESPQWASSPLYQNCSLDTPDSPWYPWLHSACRILQHQSSSLSLHTRRLQANRTTAEPHRHWR